VNKRIRTKHIKHTPKVKEDEMRALSHKTWGK
jgi:hypothetical protein